MDQNSLLISSIITIFYVLSKFIEYKYILKEEIPLKTLIKDAVLIYVSSIGGLFISAQVNTKLNLKKSTGAFINKPDF